MIGGGFTIMSFHCWQNGGLQTSRFPLHLPVRKEYSALTISLQTLRGTSIPFVKIGLCLPNALYILTHYNIQYIPDSLYQAEFDRRKEQKPGDCQGFLDAEGEQVVVRLVQDLPRSSKCAIILQSYMQKAQLVNTCLVL